MPLIILIIFCNLIVAQVNYIQENVFSIMENRGFLHPTIDNLLPLFLKDQNKINEMLNLKDQRINALIPQMILKLSETDHYRPVLNHIYNHDSLMNWEPDQVLSRDYSERILKGIGFIHPKQYPCFVIS